MSRSLRSAKNFQTTRRRQKEALPTAVFFSLDASSSRAKPLFERFFFRVASLVFFMHNELAMALEHIFGVPAEASLTTSPDRLQSLSIFVRLSIVFVPAAFHTKVFQ